MKTEKITQKWKASGVHLLEFMAALRDIDESTKVVITDSDNLTLAAILSSVEDFQEAGYTCGFLYGRRDPLIDTADSDGESTAPDTSLSTVTNWLSKNGLCALLMQRDARPQIKKINAKKLADRFGEGIAAELQNQSKMLLCGYDPTTTETIAISPLAISSLLRRARLAGDAMLEPTLGRTMEIFKSLQRKPQELQLVIRGEELNGTFKKDVLVAAHSKKYAYVPQTILNTLYNELALELGKGQGHLWEVTQALSFIYITLPQLAEEMAEVYGLPDAVVPGVYLATSDVGEASVTIRGFWKIRGNCICSGEELVRNHRGDFNVEEFIAEAKKKIFSEFATVPNRLCELLKIDIKDPKAALKYALKGANIVKAIGKKQSVQLTEDLFREIDPRRKYTAYDIAMAVAILPDRMRAAGYLQSKIIECERVAKSAIFLKYTDIESATIPHLTV